MIRTALLKITFLLVLVSFIQSSLLAQVANISLKNQKINLPQNNYHVSNIFDARIDNKYIGLVYGYDNQIGVKTMVGFKEPLNMELISLFEIQNVSNTNGTPLYITVNKLQVSDNGGVNKLFRLLEINMDFYIKENNLYYHEFTAGKYITSNYNLKTQQIDKMIADAISNCYSEFLYRMDNNIGYHKQVDFENLKQNSLDLQTQNKNFELKGKNRIFYTFNMFRDNMADSETQFFLKNLNKYHNDLTVLRYYPSDYETAAASTIWGVVYDNNLYLQVDGIFNKTDRTTDGYIVRNMTSFNNNSKASKGFKTGFYVGLAPGFFLGGFAGAAVVSAVSGVIGAAIGAASQNIVMSSTSYKIDMVTGLPKPILIKDFEEIKNMKQLVFYSRKIKSEAPELFIDEKFVCQFRTNSYFIYHYPDTLDKVNVCLKSNDDSICDNIKTDAAGKKYFEVIVRPNRKLSLFEKKQSQTINYVDVEIKKRKLRSLN